MLTQHELKQILRYDPDTGLFYRLTGKRSGKQTGTLRRDGYVVIKVDKVRTAHRLAFLYMTGSFPVHEIDHVNGDTADNRWANLRLATRSENMQNRHGANSNSKTGLLGAQARGNVFRAQIKISGRCVSLGTFSSPEAAHAAYLKAKEELHPFSTL